MSRQRWFDRNGEELHEGDTIRNIYDGKTEKVYACHLVGDPNTETLGINASNEAFLKLHPDWPREVYPFTNFASKLNKNCQQELSFYEKVVK